MYEEKGAFHMDMYVMIRTAATVRRKQYYNFIVTRVQPGSIASPTLVVLSHGYSSNRGINSSFNFTFVCITLLYLV